MSSTRKSRQISKSKTLARTTIFGPPPILPGEDLPAYEELATQVASAVNATSIIERIWIKDIADLTWEITRLRKLKAQFVSDHIPGLLIKYFEYLRDPDKLVRKWVSGDLNAKARVEKRLASMNLTIDRVYGQALVKDFDNIERIDQMIMVIERRRNAVFHEIDRHRAALSRTLRDNVDKIEDAEFRELERETDSPKMAVEVTAS
jgi:hypothetical protein